MSPQTVLLRTTLTWMIITYLLTTQLLGPNHLQLNIITKEKMDLHLLPLQLWCIFVIHHDTVH